MLWRKRLAEPIGASSYFGAPTPAVTPPGGHDPEGLFVGGQVADGLEDHVRALATRELTDFVDAFLAAGGDDVGGTELPAELGARRMATHEDDLLGAEALGGQDGQEADGAVADHRDARALVDVTGDGRVV